MKNGDAKKFISIMYWNLQNKKGFIKCYNHKYMVYIGDDDENIYIGKVKTFIEVEKFLHKYFKNNS